MTGPTHGSTVGLVANPASGHDLRRLISGASIATNLEKVNVVRRLLSGLGATGVERVLMMPDASGLTLGVERAHEQHRVDRDGVWPEVEFVSIEVRQTIEDTHSATRAMLTAGVGAIVVLGGDGTARAVASVIDDTPLLALSTGTNNAFGVMTDATVAGLAGGFVANGCCPVGDGCRRAKRLDVRFGDRTERALVDVAVVDADGVGARAVWHPSTLRELVVTIAEPGAIGLSAIAAAVSPSRPDDPTGRHLTLGTGGRAAIAAIAPGLVRSVSVAATRVIQPDEPFRLDSTTGVLALDGERDILLDRGDTPEITLTTNGPLVIDVPKVLGLAAERGWLRC